MKKINFKKSRLQKGFSIAEVITAVFLFTVGILGAYTLIQQTISYISTSSPRLVSAYLAQEGVEIVRSLRDSNWLAKRTDPDLLWNSGLTGCSLGCEADYNDSALVSYTGRFLRFDDNFYNYDFGTETPFKRKITIISSADILKVSVEVSWQERGRAHQFVVKNHLYKWR